jgi:hypothetical protein
VVVAGEFAAGRLVAIAVNAVFFKSVVASTS